MRKANIVTAMVLDGEPLRPEGTYSATGDERGVLASTSRRDDGHGLKPSGQPCADVARSGSCTLSYEKGEHTGERKRQELKIGTWNVRTMNLKGKLENVKEEMKRNNLNVLGVSEVRWIGDGDFVSDQYRVIYAGGEERQRGVAIILDSEAGQRVFDIKRCGDRIIMIKMHGELANIVLIQVYMPTSEHSDDEVEVMYEKLEELLREQKGSDYVVIMGDWNAMVGEGREELVVGKFGLGVRNERGEQMVDFCKRNKLVVTNTWFDNQKRRRYTWKKPGDVNRYQIDYILVRQRYRNSVKSAQSYPGADADTDHNLVAMRVKLKLKKLKRGKNRRKWDMEKLKANQKQFRFGIENDVQRNVTGTVEEKWSSLRDIILKNARIHVGYRQGKRAKKPWITEAMLQKMRERRKWKSKNTMEGRTKYKQLNNELRRETEKARAEWWERECEELEGLEASGRSDLMYAKVRRLTRKGKAAGGNLAINDKDGKLITDPDKVRARWKEYIEALYDKPGKPEAEDIEMERETSVLEDFKGPELLTSEITEAIEELKQNKAVGVDDIPAEFLKVLGEKAIKELVEMCKTVYNEGVWPEDFTRVVMIPLQKKPNALECGDHRTISLISHASKILLKILTKRIEAKAKGFIGQSQFGFRKGVGTRDAIGVVRMLCERSLEHGNDVYICFVDFEKAFDRVNWIKMMDVLKQLQVDWKDRRLIYDLYMRQQAVIKVADGESEPGEIGRGVRQGCPLSPLLFSIYAEAMMSEAMEDIDEGVSVGGELIKDVRFADDQAMMACTEQGLQEVMDGLNGTAKRYDMKINVKKTKSMVVSRDEGRTVNIVIDGDKVEQVPTFKYLGALVTERGTCIEEVKARIGTAKVAFDKLKELVTKRFKRELKKRMVKALVWPVALYGCETWTMKKEVVDKLNAFEMWVWRRMERVSWKDKKTNEEILATVGEERRFVKAVVMRKKNWIGHVVRGESLLQSTLEGRMVGKKIRGRPRMGMIDDLKEGSYVAMKRRAGTRDEWKAWMPRTCR
jgi:hypothetical protein